jgi:DNA-directed RNA polymerase specialized sigma24 family protein
MTAGPYVYKKEGNRVIEKASFKNMTDHELVRFCIENNRLAWEEFFRRFIPEIKQAIRKRLKSCGRENLCHDQEVLWSIHEKIVVKLYSQGILRQCTNPAGIRFWLRAVVHNQTTDWLIEQGRKKRLPQRQSEDSLLSLSDQLKGNPDLTISDTIADDQQSTDELQTYLERSLDQLGEIKNDKKLWVLRLTQLHDLPPENCRNRAGLKI